MDQRQKALNLVERAYHMQMAGRLEEAATLYQQSLTLHPTAEAYTYLGWTCSQQGNLERAIALCRRAIATDPEFGNPYADIGAYLVQLHRYHEARLWLRRASHARRYAGLSSAHYNLGQIFEHLGEEAKACDAYRLALRDAPECDPARQAWWRLVCRSN